MAADIAITIVEKIKEKEDEAEAQEPEEAAGRDLTLLGKNLSS